jgi:hypothetical protein
VFDEEWEDIEINNDIEDTTDITQNNKQLTEDNLNIHTMKNKDLDIEIDKCLKEYD